MTTNFYQRIINGPAYIIAELSANHNSDIKRAEDIIKAAAEAGADAIKLQTYTADTLTIDCDSELFTTKKTIWEGKNLYQLYQEAYMPWEWQGDLIKLANSLGLDCFSTPFDHTAVDFLETLDVPCYKVASFEIVDIPLLKKIAQTGKPVIMSTGMGTLAEIEEAVTTLRNNGCTELALLKCTSAYPAPAEEANLRTIPHMAQTFGCPVGLSDHTLGSAVAVASVAIGGTIVEKHFTLSRDDGGPDATFSMEPDELKQMVADIRTTEAALGKVSYAPTSAQKKSLDFRRSLFVVEDIREGDEITEENVRSIRPGHGLHTRNHDVVMGMKATRNLEKGTPLDWDMIRR